MATSKEFLNFVLESFDPSDGVTARAMMGEYCLYRQGVLFGGLYDGRVLVKSTENNAQFRMPTAIPYNGAKPMYFVDADDRELMREVARVTSEDMARVKSKKKK